VGVDISDSVPEVVADPGILERIIVNLVSNALRYSPPDDPPKLTASSVGDRVELLVMDRGPGIPEADRMRIFVPFQRLGDTDNTAGVGLGLALSRGFAEAMGGSLDPEETPGGGLTMILSLPAGESGSPDGEADPGRREREADPGRRGREADPGRPGREADPGWPGRETMPAAEAHRGTE
jgi:two-component system, OmpR family, sensor histidine kinase KdpD